MAKSAGTCFKPLTEIKHNNVSLYLNFYAYIPMAHRVRVRLGLGLGLGFVDIRVRVSVRVSVVYAKVYNFS